MNNAISHNNSFTGYLRRTGLNFLGHTTAADVDSICSPIDKILHIEQP